MTPWKSTFSARFKNVKTRLLFWKPSKVLPQMQMLARGRAKAKARGVKDLLIIDHHPPMAKERGVRERNPHQNPANHLSSKPKFHASFAKRWVIMKENDVQKKKLNENSVQKAKPGSTLQLQSRKTPKKEEIR